MAFALAVSTTFKPEAETALRKVLELLAHYDFPPRLAGIDPSKLAVMTRKYCIDTERMETSTMAKSRTYDYQPPSYESTVDRAERKGSMFDSMFKDARFYRTKQGVNLLRILPPGWPKANHYGLTIYSHRGVGPNDRQYLCLRENPSSPHRRCPICEELAAMGSRASQEDKQQLRAKPSVAYYVIDRDNEKEGVQIWVASTTIDSEIAAQSVNRRSKSVIDIVHPEDGYDIEFTRTGTTRNNTRYRGFQIVREPSPLHDNEKRQDEWLDLAFDKPLPSLLQFYSPEHIEEVFYGRSKEDDEEPRARRRARDADDDDEQEEAPRSRSSRARDDDEEEPPLRRTRRSRDDEEEDDEPSRRARRDAADEDAQAPSRSRRSESADDEAGGGRRRRPTDDEEPEDVRPRRRAGRDEEDERPRSGRRSRLSEELDDEIPSEGGRRARPNGRDEEGKAEASRGRRRRPADDAEEEGEPDDAPPRRAARGRDDDEQEEHSARRGRMRARLDREA